MFIKKTKAKGYEYLQLVQGYREDGKVKHKVMANLGKVELLRPLAKKLYNILEDDKTNKLRDITSLKELNRYNYGFIVYKKIWDRFNLDNILDSIVSDKKIKYDFKQIVFSIVIDRLLSPKSKLSFFNNKDDYFNINKQTKLQNIYRALDILANSKDEIELSLFNKNKSLFNISTDIVFYDVTTLYYESKNENDLKRFGYSKDGKFGDVQIVMGLLIDKNGLPIGYELFSGNTMDSKTMIKILDKLKEKFKIDTVVIVADRGLNSKLNLKAIKDAGYDYLMASKIKSMSQNIQDDILNIKDYTIINNKESEDGLYSYKIIYYNNKVSYKEELKDPNTGEIKQFNKEIILKEKLVCTYSDKRAKKDRYDRYRGLEKANKIIQENQKSSINQTRSFKKYILKSKSNDQDDKECKDFIMGLDWLKIKKDKTYDGFYAITTSKTELDHMQIIENYHNLYKIEDSFKVLKSTFKTRPIFHYNENRIQGHFITCFLAFMIERDLEIRLKNSIKFKDITVTPNRIREALNSLNISEIELEDEIFYLKSKEDNSLNKMTLANKILDFLKIKSIKNLNSKEEIQKLLQI